MLASEPSRFVRADFYLMEDARQQVTRCLETFNVLPHRNDQHGSKANISVGCVRGTRGSVYMVLVYMVSVCLVKSHALTNGGVDSGKFWEVH